MTQTFRVDITAVRCRTLRRRQDGDGAPLAAIAAASAMRDRGVTTESDKRAFKITSSM